MSALQKLLDKLRNAAGLQPDDALDDIDLILVPAAEFFEGNTDPHSFAVNVDIGGSGHPRIATFARAALAAAARPEVHAVFVGIVEIDHDGETWPYADTLYLITCSDPVEVKAWFADLWPDDAWTESWDPPPPGAVPVPQGFAVVAVWWD